MNKALKVSIVEDDKVIMSLTAQRVTKLGYLVHSQFETGETALQQLPESLPDIIIMDINLGGDIDGIEVALTLQKQHNIPFVFVSSHRDDETINRVKKVEGAEYIVKPFTDAGLRIAIGLAMDKYQAICQKKRRQELQEMLLNQFIGAMIATDNFGVITYLNDRAVSLLKWTGQVDGIAHFREIVTIIDSKNGKPLENMYERILLEKRTCWLPPNSALVALDKTTVPVVGSASPLVDTTGTIIGIMVVLFSVSNVLYMEFRGKPAF